MPFLVAVICLTGLEPECAKGLRGDCLSSPSGGFWTLAYDKPRAHTGTGKTMRVRGGGTATPAGLIQLAVRLTQPAREAAGSTALWVGAGDDGLRAFFDDGHQMNTQVRAWMDRHRLDQLTDYGGGRVRLDLRRLRKTVKSGKYLAAGGVLDDFTAGHSRQVAASRYADIGAHREIHDRAVEAGLEQALAVALPPPAVIPAGAGLPGVLTPPSSTQPAAPATTCSSPRAPASMTRRSPVSQAGRARSRCGAAWNARTRCSLTGTCPASSRSPASWRTSGRRWAPRSGPPATALPGSA